MRAEACLQNTWNRAPYSAAGNGDDASQGNEHPGRQVGEFNSDPGSCECRDRELSFGADVQQAATKRDCYRESRKNKRRRIEERVSNAVRPGKRASDQQAICIDRVIANERDKDPAADKSGNNGQQRKYQFARVFHLPPVIISPISSFVARAGLTSPTIRP